MVGHTLRSEVRNIVSIAMVCSVGSLMLIFNTHSVAQDTASTRIKGIRRGGELTFEPTGPGVMFGALDPAVKKWYVPQELYLEYQWKQWEYTNYARNRYQRYVDISNEGDYFYDLYGSYITRGWLIYDWTQTQPQQGGQQPVQRLEVRELFQQSSHSLRSKGTALPGGNHRQSDQVNPDADDLL